MKQTAVEWLESRIKVLIPDDIGSQLMFKSNIKKAKAKELEQIKDAWLNAWKDSMINPLEDKYYEPEA